MDERHQQGNGSVLVELGDVHEIVLEEKSPGPVEVRILKKRSWPGLVEGAECIPGYAKQGKSLGFVEVVGDIHGMVKQGGSQGRVEVVGDIHKTEVGNTHRTVAVGNKLGWVEDIHGNVEAVGSN